MELTEVVSPSVAVPVLCVLVCAFLVFAFGFKSPAQPPSFDVFDEDGKKKRTKKSKGSKGQSNGHAVIAGEGDINNSAKVQSSPRQTVKQQANKTQAAVTKSKVASQPAQDAPKKVKKQTAKEEEGKVTKKQVVQEDATNWQSDVDGWHTVPKKDKKQKKKESEPRPEKQDSPVKEEEIVVKIEEPAAAAASVDMTEESTGSPQEQRSKRKKEKGKKKTKSDEEVVEQSKMEEQVVAEATPSVTTEPVEPEVVDCNIELQIMDAMETTVDDDDATIDKKKKGKKDKKKALSGTVEDDFVIPQAAMATESVQEPLEDLPLKENTEALTVKVPKKKQKKDRSKKNEEKLAENIEIGASGEVDASLSQTSVSDTQPKKTKVKDTSVKEDPPVIESIEEVGASSNIPSPAQPTASFDELGGMTESWTEAKPKSKKKKARRAD